MSRDHDRLDSIFKEFEKHRGKKSSKTKQLFSRFKQGLERHIVWEEEILFPSFENKTGIHDDGPTTIMRIEHKDIKRYLEGILNKISSGDFETEDLEKLLIGTLSDHNHKEEMILYPWIDETIDKKERIKILSQLK